MPLLNTCRDSTGVTFINSKSIEFSSLAEAVWSCCALRLLWASGPLSKGTNRVHSRRSLLTCQPFPTPPTPPPPPLLWSKSLQRSTLWGRDRKQLVVLSFSFFFCSCYVLYLFESCIMLSLISVLLHRCQWFVDHLLAWHPHMALQRHTSTRHPHLIASTITHGHFIRACLSTVVTLSFE